MILLELFEQVDETMDDQMNLNKAIVWKMFEHPNESKSGERSWRSLG